MWAKREPSDKNLVYQFKVGSKIFGCIIYDPVFDGSMQNWNAMVYNFETKRHVFEKDAITWVEEEISNLHDK